jgi:hypothetical protein
MRQGQFQRHQSSKPIYYLGLRRSEQRPCPLYQRLYHSLEQRKILFDSGATRPHS